MRPTTSEAPGLSARTAAATAGAVDLAALQARSQAAARAAESPPPAPGATVIAVDEAAFQSEVLDRSFQVPVVLDLWADWCQPCKQLSPILERLAAEDAGRWVLATIDVDANPRISQALQVQGIPAVFAVIGGQVVPGFTGALPEAQVREFIVAVVQAGEQAGLTGAPTLDPDGAPEVENEAAEVLSDPRFDAAEAALDAGDFDGAAAAYQLILDAEPANTEASLALRQTRFLQRLATTAPGAGARANAAPDDVELALAAADEQMSAGDVSGAFDRLITLVTRVRGEERDPVRDRLVDYFELLGPDEPQVGPARRRLASALF
ncbi:MAG: tetratricopeptide repeat protein [bacterium]